MLPSVLYFTELSLPDLERTGTEVLTLAFSSGKVGGTVNSMVVYFLLLLILSCPNTTSILYVLLKYYIFKF